MYLCLFLICFEGHEFISILYCQVPLSKNKVDYYYITLILELQTTQCAISCKYSIIERDESKTRKEKKNRQMDNQICCIKTTFGLFSALVWSLA